MPGRVVISSLVLVAFVGPSDLADFEDLSGYFAPDPTLQGTRGPQPGGR